MKNVILSALAIAIMSTASPVRAQGLLANTQQRLLLRLERWEVICDRREARKNERLVQRGLSGPTTLSASDEACGNIRDRLTDIRGTSSLAREPETPSIPSPPIVRQTPPKPDLLPNQTYIPTYPLPSFDAGSRILLLGEQAKVVATIEVTPDDEPVGLRTVKITLTTAVESVISFEVIDDVGFALGSATLDLDESADRNVFTLDLSPKNAYYIEKDDRIVIAVRPRLKEIDNGGLSAETIKVDRIDVSAVGRWTSRQSTVITSGTDFQKHQTALAMFSSIERDGNVVSIFSVGSNKKIGAFDFAAVSTNDSEADPAVTALTFSVSAPSEVTLSNTYLRGNDSNLEHSCTVGGLTITCSSIPALIGNLQSPRTLSIYADIALTTHPDPFLMMELNRPGTPDSAGDITWTDGVSTFTWVPFDSPIVRGTSWE